MVWTDDTIRQLKDLWAEGHSTAEIGRRLGVSKNAIVGKAHRLQLDARPSPIRRDSSDRPAPTPRLGAPTLPPLASAAAAPALPARNVQPLRREPEAHPAPPARPVTEPQPILRAIQPIQPVAVRRSAPSCCWPIGEPGTRSFRFCDDPSMPGKPYCEEHAKLAYVRVKDRKEDAA